jgi:hypothetical protein
VADPGCPVAAAAASEKFVFGFDAAGILKVAGIFVHKSEIGDC